jgi:hypothetical protein
MYEHEEVEEKEAQQLAKELGAIFQKTSAKEATGVEDLFLKIGNKFVNPTGTAVGGSGAKGDKIKLEKGKGSDKPGKKGCC